MNVKCLEFILHAIREAHHTFPELRVGQLLINCVPPGKDLFYVTDMELLQFLKDYLNKEPK